MQPESEGEQFQPPLMTAWPWILWAGAFTAWQACQRAMLEPWLRAAQSAQRTLLSADARSGYRPAAWPAELPRIEARVTAVPAQERGGADDAARVSTRMWIPATPWGGDDVPGETIAVDAIVVRASGRRRALPRTSAAVIPLRPRRGKSRG